MASDRSRRRFIATGLSLGGTVIAARTALAADPPAPASPAGLTVAPASQAGASPRLTFHGIDTWRGVTVAGLKVALSRFEGGAYQLINTFETVAGGRVADPLLLGDAYRVGRYEVLVDIGDYFARLGAPLPQPAFLTKVPLRFAIHDAAERVHLPILFTPWSYSFYRGS